MSIGLWISSKQHAPRGSSAAGVLAIDFMKTFLDFPLRQEAGSVSNDLTPGGRAAPGDIADPTRSRSVPIVVLLLVTEAILLMPTVFADDDSSRGGQEAASSAAEKVFLLPIEFDFDSGAANGNALIARLLPVNSLLVKDTWKLLNVALITLADAPGGVPGFPGNPEPVPGEKVFGLADFTDAILYTPIKSKGLMWGVGGMFGFPTATNDVLGSGQWSAGPAVRLGYRSGPWHLGLLAGNRWSFAGDSDRAEVHQLMARGLVRCKLGKGWFFIYAPIITANWNASSGQRWLVPLGGGIGKSFKFRPSLNISVQAYGNVIKPDGAPDSVLRIAFGFPFRLPGRP